MSRDNLPFISSMVHQLSAGATPLLVYLKVDSAPVIFVQQAEAFDAKLKTILTTARKAYQEADDSSIDALCQELLTDLQAIANEFSALVATILQAECLQDSPDIQESARRLRDTLQTLRLLW